MGRLEEKKFRTMLQKMHWDYRVNIWQGCIEFLKFGFWRGSNTSFCAKNPCITHAHFQRNRPYPRLTTTNHPTGQTVGRLKVTAYLIQSVLFLLLGWISIFINLQSYLILYSFFSGPGMLGWNQLQMHACMMDGIGYGYLRAVLINS